MGMELHILCASLGKIPPGCQSHGSMQSMAGAHGEIMGDRGMCKQRAVAFRMTLLTILER